MNLRLSSLRAMFVHQGARRLTAAAALALALGSAAVGSAVAAPGDAASAPDAASVSYANGGQFTVRPGQSLNDVAIAVTQSHDRATLARASRALFEANPNAFMSHDPSRMRVGAVLTVPALDASGALAASSAGVASAGSAAAAPASTPSTVAASGVAQVNAAAVSAASAASAAARAATPAVPAVSATTATPAMSAPASAVAEASSATAGGTASSAPIAGSQAAVLPASTAHEWTGSIQPSASEPVEGASAAGAGTIGGASAAQPASQPRVQVSSLQQLLALKNRVLMELQKHGIGGTPAVKGGASNSVAPSAPGASSVAAAPGHAVTPAASTSKDVGMSQTELSVAAAVGAALVALLAALRMGRRKRERAVAAEAASEGSDLAASGRSVGPQEVVEARAQTPSVHETPDADDEVAARNAAALAATEREAAEGDAAAREMAERVAAERDAEIRRAAAREAEEQALARAAAEKAAAERMAAEKGAAERVAAERAAAEPAAAEQAAADRAAADHAAAEPAAAEQAAAAEHAAAEHAAAEHAAAEHAAADRAATEQSASSHASTNHAASPAQDPTAPQQVWHEHDTTSASAESAHVEPNSAPSAQSDFAPEPLPAPPLDHFDDATMAASLAAAAELGAEALPLAPPEPLDEAFPHEEPVHRLQWDDVPAEPQEPSVELHQSAQTEHAPSVPTEFPRDAVDAFGSLDMPLPPRVESSADRVHAPASLSTQPVASPEATAKQSAAEHHPNDTPHVADEIAAGTAGHASVAGLGAGFGAGFGASGFGALKLDFDLELPPSPAEPLPAFTPADLTRIARNKLDLAAEYIELGDLSGARALINEVIEANDPGTRTEARALLSTLAPLS
ncbi:FimV/HubP family polar landmark protein [Paraburkholderia aromaticivorans]|uniref:FimV/HubP family polar landmark protein n=1 Tax=Paraburkholderia aromaticivorans TaxID=2026199 RepID=UPI0038BA42E1